MRRVTKSWEGKPEWQAWLVARYVEPKHEELAEGDEPVTTLNRRLASPSSEGSPVMRTFERGSCGLDTAILLDAAVDCEVRIIQLRVVQG